MEHATHARNIAVTYRNRAGTSAFHAAATRPGGGPVATRAQWPLASYLPLGALPAAVGCGRHHVRHILAEWGLTALIDDAVLVTSELLTNAVKASQTLPTPVPTPIALRLLANDRQLIIEAWGSVDRGLQTPAAPRRRTRPRPDRRGSPLPPMGHRPRQPGLQSHLVRTPHPPPVTRPSKGTPVGQPPRTITVTTGRRSWFSRIIVVYPPGADPGTATATRYDTAAPESC